MEILAAVAVIVFGSAILGTLLVNTRTLGRMDAKLAVLCQNDADKEKRLRTLERQPLGRWPSPKTDSPPA